MAIRILTLVDSICRIKLFLKFNERSLFNWSFKNLMNNHLRRNVDPPYHHICQIGDPVLRGKAEKVDSEMIKMKEFQEIVQHLKKVMQRYKAMGLSAPQIGLPWQLFVMEINEQHVYSYKENAKIQGVKTFPMTVFINPKIEVTDQTVIALPESCGSVYGFSAAIPRYKGIQITALDEFGKCKTLMVEDWTARVIQHEFDHLSGVLFTDKMNPLTLSCIAWDRINKYRGRVELRYCAKF